jgi:hypothetical protein
MPVIDYARSGWQPRTDTLEMIARANQICAEYRAQGFDLTLRQLYYQFVARGWLPNKQQSYDRLGVTCVKARENGMMDWNYLVDRTRNLQSVGHWDDPADILEAVARQFRIDKWAEAPHRVEVWVEKEALAGVIERAARAADVAWFSCRGYVSSSEIWGASMRLQEYLREGKSVTVLHLGDHDPSGLQMSEDIEKRLTQFVGHHVGWRIQNLEVKRIALTQEQIDQYDPPPNPAKETDSRYQWYVDQTGLDESWELDALDPNVIVDLVTQEVEALRDPDVWTEARREEQRHRRLLSVVKHNWSELVDYLEENGFDPDPKFVEEEEAQNDNDDLDDGNG